MIAASTSANILFYSFFSLFFSLYKKINAKPQDPTSYLQFLHLRVTIPPPPAFCQDFQAISVFFCNFENLSCNLWKQAAQMAALFLSLFLCFSSPPLAASPAASTALLRTLIAF